MAKVTEPVVGKKYRVYHRRKGEFDGVVLHITDEWIYLDVAENEGFEGGEVGVRRSFCTLEEIKE